MLAGLPITERVLDVRGVETTVLEAGDGPPVVLLHGGIECGGAYWAPVIARLAEHNRLVVPDAPGLGESLPVRRLDDDTFAAWFTGVLEQTHAEQPTLVAHSLLGSAAARFAARRGDLLRGLVVYGAPGVAPSGCRCVCGTSRSALGSAQTRATPNGSIASRSSTSTPTAGATPNGSPHSTRTHGRKRRYGT